MLQEANEERKAIERELKEQAMVIAQRQVDAGANGLAIWLEDGSASVHGIVASRLVSSFGRPTLCISPKLGHPGIVSASARTIPGFHVRDGFAWIHEQRPDLLLAWGGHEGAGGLTARKADIPALQSLWDQAVANSGIEVGPYEMTDGALPRAPDFGLLTELGALEPFGREFDTPKFAQKARLLSASAVGDGKHLKLKLDILGNEVAGIWFNIPSLDWRPQHGLPVELAFELGANTFRGNTSLQAMISHMRPIV